MRKIERVLLDIYPGRDPDSFSVDEIAVAERAIAAANRDAQRSRIPRRDVRVGETFLSKGKQYRCIRRPSRIEACEACSGCAFLKRHCPAAKCSHFDRADGNNVWFIEESSDGQQAA